MRKKMISSIFIIMMLFCYSFWNNTAYAESETNGEEYKYQSQINANKDPKNAINADGAEYLLSFNVNRPGANHDGVIDAYKYGWTVQDSPIHDETGELKNFAVKYVLHIAGQSENKVGQMALEVNKGADPWNKYRWNGETSFNSIAVPNANVEFEYYTNDDGSLISHHLLKYDLFLSQKGERIILKIPKLENNVIAYEENDQGYKNVLLVENLETSISPEIIASKKIYLNGKNGNDTFDGKSPEQAVKTFEKAKELAVLNKKVEQIIVLGTTSVKGEVTLEGTNAILVRGENFNDYLLKIDSNNEATLSNIIIDGNASQNSQIEKSLIDVQSKGTLNINGGTVLKNNIITAIKNTATKGGAINLYDSSINIAGGIIENNQATYGGGIYLNKSKMNFSAGIVQKNASNRVYDSNVNQYYAAGGGILADQGSTVNLSGDAKILSNTSAEIGGGISIGSQEWGDTNILNMTGGTIDGNTAGSSGGGVFVQAKYFSGGASKAYIEVGNITNNTMDGRGVTNKSFGGGGIYVNGANNLNNVNGDNSELYLKNVLITNNQAVSQGAGYAACPISKTKIFVTDGGAIFGNKTSSGGKDLYILSSDYYGYHSGIAEYKLSKRMLGGVLYNWKTDDGVLLADDKYDGKVPSNSEFGLYADSEGNELTQALAKVIITGNTSATRGGGIGSNGSVTIGTEGETTEVSVIKKWKDNNNVNKKRPESIIVQLIAHIEDKEYLFEERGLKEENNWKTVFSNLPIKIGEKNVSYTVKEVKVKGYTGKITGNMNKGFIITNTPDTPWKPMDPPTRDLKVTKTWKDSKGKALQAPIDKVIVELYRDGQATGETLELNASNQWTGSFKGLKAYESIEHTTAYQYTVKEVGENGNAIELDGKWYTVSYQG
ncbi:Cna B-type domain-containing protein, partial [Atopobacter phocae]|uniref:Cna B-type domain-containing protein n=1 Tax=Atopobacter phocae TaxID=136492 RepID=UPI00047097CE